MYTKKRLVKKTLTGDWVLLLVQCETAGTAHVSQKTYKRDFQRRAAQETNKGDLRKTSTQEIYKRDLYMSR